MAIKTWQGTTLLAVMANLLGAVLGFVAARNLPEDRGSRMMRNMCAEFQRHCADLQLRLDEATPHLNEFIRLQRKSKVDERVGQPAPKLSAEGWINDPQRTVERLDGKVVVLDLWAFW